MSAGCESGFAAEVARREDGTTVVVRGEVDMASADAFRAALDDALRGCRGRLEVDLGQTTFMDSSGLAVLVGAHRRLGQAHEAIVVIDPPPSVRRVLDLSGLSELIDVRTAR